MKVIKQLFENIFGKIAELTFTHRIKTIVMVVLVNMLLFSQLSHLQMDTSNESFFRKDDPVLISYNQFRDQFGKDEFIVIGLEHPVVFSLDFLKGLEKLHRVIEEKVPYLDKVTSLVNIRNTRGEEEELIVEDFLQQWPTNQEDLHRLKKRAAENPLYRNYVLSEDDSMTAIIIKPLACNPDIAQAAGLEGSCQPMSDPQNREMMAAIEEILQKHVATDVSVAVSGLPAIIDYLNLTLEKDLSTIIPLLLLVVLIFLGLMFRRFSGVLYPMVIFLMSLLSTISLMASFDIPMTSITTILPSFIFVVSVSDAVHILALFFPYYQKSGDRKQAIIKAMKHSGLAVFMTTLTTAAGLFSFIAAEVAPVADLGIVAPIGIFIALIYTILLLPALLSLFPLKHKGGINRTNRVFDSLCSRITAFSHNNRPVIFIVFSILLLLSLGGIGQLKFSHKLLNWFKPDTPIRVATELLDTTMSGTISLDVIIDTEKADGLYDPAFIRNLEKISEKLEDYRHEGVHVGKVLALNTVIKETHRALHNNNLDFYTLPEETQLIAQELFLFQMSGSDDLEELVDQQFSKTRLTMHLPYRDTNQYDHFIHFLERELERHFPEEKITITGVNALFVEILNNVMATMLNSYGLALALISLLMIFMLGKLRMGLLSMIPNVFPILVILGCMGWFGIPLDLGTILIGSIAIGIIVDDTIHFLHNYGRYHDLYADPMAATKKTLTSVGRAMLITSVVLIAGYLSYLFSDLTINQDIGFLIAATVFIALVTDFLLLPALLSMVYGKKTIQSTLGAEVTQ